MVNYTTQQINHIKQQALIAAQHHNFVMMLDNNFSINALGLHQIEFAAAFGVSDYISVNQNSFDALEEFLCKHQHKYVFTQMGYDLKNQLEKLQSNHPNNIGFDDLIAFVPEQLVVIDAEGNCIFGDDVSEQLLHQQHTLADVPHKPVSVKAKVSKQQYLIDVEHIRQHILEGDVYELNYCTEFYHDDASINPYQVYDKLKSKSPVPFGAFFKWDKRYLLCASPERFMTKIGNKVYSQPIKGTTPRCANKADDEAQKQHLLNSEKERAENLMIVDLVRNDLARTAQTGTVMVDELFGIYSFKQVHQMISTVSAKPKQGVSVVEVIKNAFPMGSMTGAPKIMAMQLIEKYEQTQRGLYSGTVGYFAPNGNFDLNVVIRSLQFNTQTNYLSFEVGSAITYDSQGELEYEECLLKASAMVNVLLGE
jgi:para-aminobenzoate synthetase component 1